MADIFNEIDEQIRKDKAQEIWQKYNRLIIGFFAVVLAIVIAITSYNWWKNEQQMKNAALFHGAITLMEDGNHQAAIARLAQIEGEESYGLLARLQEAKNTIELGDYEKAVAIYDGLANAYDEQDFIHYMTKKEAVFASLQGGMIGLEQAYAQITSMIDDNHPMLGLWHFYAAELALRMGDEDKAMSHLTIIDDDEGISPALANKARDFMTMLNPNL